MRTSQPGNGSSHAHVWTSRYTGSVINRRTYLGLTLAGVTLLVAAFSFGKPGQPATRLPALPAASGSHAAPAVAAAGSAAAAVNGIQRAQRGVVVLERGGKPIGLGAVLGTDGRMLTSLSILGDGIGVDARYADNSLVNVRVGHFDRVWDLALLVPQVGRWDEGLSASSVDPIQSGARIRTFTQRGGRAVVATAVLKGRTELIGGDGELLRDALELTTRVAPSDLGAPLVDDQGKVLAIISRACAPTGADAGVPCRPVAYGAPMDVLKQFLRSAPANAIPPSPWLGIQGVGATTQTARGVRVAVVHPGSPAAEAGLKAASDAQQADVIIAVNGEPVQTPEGLAALVRERAVGETVNLIVLCNGKFRVVPIVLRAASTGKSKSPGTQ